MKNLLFLLLFLTAAFAACTPNRSIALDNKANAEQANDNAENMAAPEPPKKITVAELMERVANAPPDSFLFPCTLNAYSNDDRAKLRKLKQLWLSKEQDSRYLISSSTGCVCPGICVLAVEDTKASAPKNFALLAIEGLSETKYSWVLKNLDFTNAKLIWASSTPIVQFTNQNGVEHKSCSIDFDKKQNRYVTTCSTESGKKLPPLDAE